MTLPLGAQLLISVVNRGKGDEVVKLSREAGATGGTVLFGRGTAQSSILRMLCLADVEKELVFTLASGPIMKNITELLRHTGDLGRKAPGFGLVLPVPSFFRAGETTPAAGSRRPGKEEKNMQENSNFTLLCIVVNAGHADDIMATARKAGARGGTLLKARGTVSEKDTSFFGITIVPEKEMLLILVARQSQEHIMNAVRDCRALAEPGTGIIFSLPVDEFFPLGQQQKK